MPELPKDDKQCRKHRIPDVFEADSFEIAPTTDRVGDDECVVLTAPEKQKLWLLPDKGFALRKGEYWLENQKVFVVECSDWRPVVPGAWTAGKSITTSMAIKNYYPAEFEGKALKQEIYTLTKLAVNDPASEDLLRVELKPGELVIDQNLVSGAEKGTSKPYEGGGSYTPAVTYQVPAKGEDLDRVMAEAVAKDRAKNPAAWYQSPAVWIVAAVLVGIAVVVVRASRKK